MENGDKRNERLYIPYGLKIEKEYFPGFGRKQLLQSAAGTIASVVLGSLVFLITNALLVLVIIILTGGLGSVMITIKDSVTNISVIDQIICMIKFKKQQQKFMYVYNGRLISSDTTKAAGSTYSNKRPGDVPRPVDEKR